MITIYDITTDQGREATQEDVNRLSDISSCFGAMRSIMRRLCDKDQRDWKGLAKTLWDIDADLGKRLTNSMGLEIKEPMSFKGGYSELQRDTRQAFQRPVPHALATKFTKHIDIEVDMEGDRPVLKHIIVGIRNMGISFQYNIRSDDYEVPPANEQWIDLRGLGYNKDWMYVVGVP